VLCTYSCRTLSWHVAQVSGTLSLAIGDLGSPAPRMSCSPWQSVQTAAVPEPAATALPCTLCWYEVKGAELTPDDAMTNFSPWHAPQVRGMFERATFDLGSLHASISCTLPWQSWHFATLELPAEAALAWTP